MAGSKTGPLLLIAAAAWASGRAVAPRLAYPDRQSQIVREFDQEGIPARARSTAVDPRGFFWVASDTGLYRFDGHHFRLLDPTPVVAVALASDGRVWIGGMSGLFVYTEGRLQRIGTEPVSHLAMIGPRVAAVIRNQIRLFSNDGGVPLPDRTSGGLTLDAQSRAWFVCVPDLCALDPSGRVDRQTLPEAAHGPWTRAVRDDDGNLWAWNRERTVRVRRDGEVTTYLWPERTSFPEDTRPALRTRDGIIHISGYATIEHGELLRHKPPVGGTQDVPFFSTGPYGDLWEASPGGGLALLSPRSWVVGWGPATFPTGCSSFGKDSAGPLAACGNGVLRFGGFRDVQYDEWHPVPGTTEGAPAVAVHPGQAASMWAILASRGILRLGSGGKELEAAWRGFRPRTIDFRVLFADPAGGMHVGAKSGLFRLLSNPPGIQREVLPGNGEYATAPAVGPDGRLWMGADDGILEYTGGVWKTAVPASALLNPRVRSLAVSAGPEFWVSYRATLPFSRVQGTGPSANRTDFAAENGYSPPISNAMLADRRGWIWRGTPEGLQVADGRHLDRPDWVALHPVNNLPGDLVNPFGLMEDADGFVWVAGDRGVARVDPDPAWFAGPARHRPRVTAFRWHGRDEIWPSPTAELKGAGGDLEIEFARWPSPEPRDNALQCRLTPVETSWRSSPTGRVSYGDLKSGRYRFEMRGPELGEVAATWEFQVEETYPPWWFWLAGITGAGPVIAGWTAIRRRLAKRAYWREKLALQAPLGRDEDEDYRGMVLDNRFEIDGRIGEGGFASVWEARDREKGGIAAVKFLRMEGEIAEWQRIRFEKETGALRRISHPGVVPMLGAGVSDRGIRWIAMVRIVGPSLRDVLARGPIKPSKAAAWARQLGAALAEVHACGVLHLDLKPENVLIADAFSPVERLVIVDFGAATVESLGGNTSTLVLGSFDYMAPERVQGRSTEASDVYSLASVVFEAITGVRYAGVAAGNSQAMRRLLAGFPPTVAEVLAQGLAYDPELRASGPVPFAAALADALENLSGEP